MSAERDRSSPALPRACGAAGPILLVEDDPLLAEVLRDALEDAGFDLITARDAPEALRLAAGRPPALVVLDWALPTDTGAAVVDGLRALHDRTPPLVLITGEVDPYGKADQVGAFTCLLKPFDLVHLHA